MAITFTRRQASQIRSVLRRAFGSRGPGPAICFTASAGTLSVRASSADIAAEYCGPCEANTSDALWVPLSLLDDCEGKRDEPVHVKPTDKGRVTAQWCEGKVPQMVQYESGDRAHIDKFPRVPDTFTENPFRLLHALADAGDSCDPDSVRYALGHLQLRGPQGSIGATDGRQLLVQSGFTFPWGGDLLIPRSRVFASAELAGDRPILVGQAGDWVVFRTGPWTIWLKINKDGRFPDLSRHLPRPADATTRCALSPTDAEFLAQALPRLPSDDELNFPVTLDLNGHIAIRAKASDQVKPTEVVLSGSSWSGEPVRLCTNRKFLARALKLGFHELLVYGAKVPVVCRDDHRQFAWATLDPQNALPPADDAIRIESPTDSSVPPLKPTRRTTTGRDSSTGSNGNGRANGAAPVNGHTTKSNGQARRATDRKSESHDTGALIAQAMKLRTALHDLLHEASGLVKALKQHQRQSRAIQNTLASLKQLKTLGV